MEMSSCLLVMSTWASNKSFKLNLPKMELVTAKIKVSPCKTPSCFPHLVSPPWSPPDPFLLHLLC